MKPLIVFDLDGTLIDSAPDIITAANITLQRHGKPAQSDEVITSHIGEGLRKLIDDLFSQDQLPAEQLRAIENEFLQTYQSVMFDKTRIYPGVEKFLSEYTGPVGIITNKNVSPAKALVSHLGLSRFPWVQIFGADSLAEKKPSPLPLQTMMGLANRSPGSTLMIGDGIPDMVSAQRAGVAAIGIGFGYTKTEVLQAYDPITVLNHYNELHDIVTNWAQTS